MGHGSAPGERRGGRIKGTPNKATSQRLRDIEASGKTPLQFLIDNMRNEKLDANVRIDCAKAALPYLHPRAVTTVNVDAMLQITEVRDVIVDPKAAEVIEHEVVKEALKASVTPEIMDGITTEVAYGPRGSDYLSGDNGTTNRRNLPILSE